MTNHPNRSKWFKRTPMSDFRMSPLDAHDAAKAAAEKRKNERDALWNEEFIVETNSGTFSAQDAVRTVGTGDPQHAEYRIYERVGDGRQRREGRDPHRAPGYARRFSRELTAARHRLKELA